MIFTFPLLAAIGAALACLPILIHLLNRRRRRRVEWAAMDFLLQSQRKNRTWVRLSEWLLLAARVIVIGLAGLLAATPRTADLLDGFFGGDRARHVVLLDDTCSMQRRDADQTAWDEAIAALGRLILSAKENGDEVVVVRYTDSLSDREAAVLTSDADDTPVDPATWQPTQATADAAEGLDRLKQLVEQSDAPSTHAYIFSDFAEAGHGDRDDWSYPFQEVIDNTDGVVLAACGEPDASNLTVSELTLAPGPVAAGVETRIAFEITNHSEESAAAVAVALRRNGQPLTSIEVGPFEPGDRKRIETPLTLRGVGLHVIDASLPSDRLTADDRRWLAIEAAASQSVVLVDQTGTGIESRVFSAALRPLGKTRSGWSPTRVRKIDSETLAEATTLCLLDIERLTQRETDLVRGFIADRGGLLMVLGPRTDAEWFNRSIASGGLGGAKPLVPWRLGPPTSAPIADGGLPLLKVSDHAAMRVLGGERNGFLPLVRPLVRRRLASDDAAPRLNNVTSSTSQGYKALASFADEQPLVLESRYGAGRVIGLLTTAATGDDTGNGMATPWSNLASLPIFPVLVNDLVGWLAQERMRPKAEAVGMTSYHEPLGRSTLKRWDDSGELREASGLVSNLPLTPPRPGVYQRVLGGVERDVFAAVIADTESNLAAPGLEELRLRWGEVAKVGRANDLFREETTPASRTPLYVAAALLLGLLVAERWLAYRMSYVSSAAPLATRRAAR